MKMKKFYLNTFLLNYLGMSIRLYQGKGTILKGKFCFNAKTIDNINIEDCYDLLIILPEMFPSRLPKVIEIGHKIPRYGNYHINLDDTLCLGFPLRLLKNINSNPTILGFAESC